MTDPVLWLVPILIVAAVACLALWAKLMPAEDPNEWPGLE